VAGNGDVPPAPVSRAHHSPFPAGFRVSHSQGSLPDRNLGCSTHQTMSPLVQPGLHRVVAAVNNKLLLILGRVRDGRSLLLVPKRSLQGAFTFETLPRAGSSRATRSSSLHLHPMPVRGMAIPEFESVQFIQRPLRLTADQAHLLIFIANSSCQTHP